jgi:predicted phosphodiesterase
MRSAEMLIQVLSDLHGSLPEIDSQADVVVFAGDMDTTPARVRKIFRAVRKYTDKPILYILGNHEYYDNFFPASLEKYRQSVEDLGVTLLEGSTIEFDGVLFAGCTMWTDYDNGRGEAAARSGMNDFEFIRFSNTYPVTQVARSLEKALHNTRLALPADFVVAHVGAKMFLEHTLRQNMGKKVVVVTHHVPSFSLVADRYRGDPLNGAFAANCDKLIAEYQPKLWVYGHTHQFNDVVLGGTRCVCNPGGYRMEISGYKPKFLVEV